MHYFGAESRHQVLDSEPGFSPIFLSSQHKARLLYIMIELLVSEVGKKMEGVEMKKVWSYIFLHFCDLQQVSI